MPGDMIEFRANGRMTPGYLATPPGGKGPGLVLVQEYWGLVPHIEDLARRFAAEGFVVLAPDLYRGEKTKSPDAAAKMLMALNIAEAGKDMHGAAEYLRALDAVQPKTVGILGFCMGGQLALYAVTQYPDEFAAAVDFYGVHPNAQIDPQQLRRPVLAHFAEHDTSVPEEWSRGLVEQLESAGKDIRAHFYDAGHAFFNDSRPEAYNQQAAALAWSRTLQFLHQQLGA
jgi:carboxymethylenebutenolidase